MFSDVGDMDYPAFKTMSTDELEVRLKLTKDAIGRVESLKDQLPKLGIDPSYYCKALLAQLQQSKVLLEDVQAIRDSELE